MPSAEYDVIIAGAGPAGLSTALHLQQIAPELLRRTLVLEKARHPRPKLCAGGVLPDGEAILTRLGLDICEVPHVDVDWAHFGYAGRGMQMRTGGRRSHAFRIIRRDEFDGWLASQARQRGVHIQENTTVTGITSSETRVVINTNRGDFHAGVVVGADGSNSVVRRSIASGEYGRLARLLEIITPPKTEGSSHLPADSYFDFFCLTAGISGYVWDFPTLIGGKSMRCWGIFDNGIATPRSRQPLRQALAEELARHGYRLEEHTLQAHPLRWFSARSTFSAPRVLLVGDAAGADALFGEGISLALGYGATAAAAIRDAFAGGDFSFADYRRRILASKPGRALRRRKWLAHIFYRLRSPIIQKLLWRHLGGLIAWIVQGFLINWAEE